VGREIINKKEDGSQNGNTFLRHACSSKLCRRSGQLIFGVNPLYCMMVKTCAQKTSGKSQSMLSYRRANGGSNMRWRLDGRLAPLATFIRPEVPNFEENAQAGPNFVVVTGELLHDACAGSCESEAQRPVIDAVIFVGWIVW